MAAWMAAQGEAERLFVSVVTVAEIERVAEAASRWRHSASQDALRMAAPTDRPIRRSAAGDRCRNREDRRRDGRPGDGFGVDPGFADVLIAATAQAHRLTLLTANVRHFLPLGIGCFNPIDELPETSLHAPQQSPEHRAAAPIDDRQPPSRRVARSLADRPTATC
ncbi:MAG: type II toxin-antitoxin system VapC family toxin [Rhodopseudomonas palustris]|nr:type II toxin-antitoxin system VapC family toxin [Rhodopseudomonas palustris]